MKIGSKVVCIKDVTRNPPVGYIEKYPKVGEIYTIREIVDHAICIAVKLMEIVNIPQQYKGSFGECDYNILAFREVDDTFGEVVAEQIEQQIALEEVIEV